ncbi:MAG: exo-alpha-sialidase [Phycisphaerae bacterium]|nr:exo-alpha-sialidase [Phycisphaerae bacterium]
MGYWESPCRYDSPESVEHGCAGVHGRGRAVLERSFDGGETWDPNERTTLFDESAPLEERRRWLFENSSPRRGMDMSGPQAVFHFGRTFAGEPAAVARKAATDDATAHAEGDPTLVTFIRRSVDKGHTWEEAPLVIPCPRRGAIIHRTNTPPVRQADGTFIAPFSIQDGPEPGELVLYATQDDGLTWQYISRIASGTPTDRPTYPTVIAVDDETLLCTMLFRGCGRHYTICSAESRDGGFHWTPAQPIICLGRSPWTGKPSPEAPRPFQTFWRSPYTIQLRDGRILVLYARRWPPFGMGGLLSEDGGQSWSREFILRDDGGCADIGYPVAVELDDGRMVAAYYYTDPAPGPHYRQRRYIATTHFRI